MHTFIAILGLAAVQQVTPEQLYENATPSVLTLTVDRGRGTVSMGTAFLACGKGVAVTAWHVVKGARSVNAKFSDGKVVQVMGVIDKDPGRDIALIAVESGARGPLKLADGDPKVGSKAFVIGSPKGMEFSISDGIISQTPLIGAGKLYQFTCPVSPGNSGGPLFNQSGQVLGVVSWQLRDAQNLNFAVPARDLSGLDPGKSPTPFVAATPDGTLTGALVNTVDDPALSKLLTEMDLGFKTKDDGTGKTAFVFDTEGTKITLFQYPKEGKEGPTTNLSIGAGYTGSEKVELGKLNAFNREHRFARAYRDESGTVFVENDVDLDAGVGQGRLVRFVSDFSQTVREFEQDVFGQGAFVSAQSVPTLGGDKNGLITRIDDLGIEAVLSRCGIKAVKADDGTGKNRYEFTVSGVKANLYQFAEGAPDGPTTSLSLTVGVTTGKGVALDVVNDLNASARFFKVFTDGDNDPFLVADLDLSGGTTPRSVEGFVKSFADTVPGFLKRVLGRD